MSGSEYTKAVKNLLYIRSLYDYSNPDSYYNRAHGGLPPTETLSATPFNETVFAVKPIVDSFKQNNNLDLVNIVFIQDGDADATNRYVSDPKSLHKAQSYYNLSRENVILTDKKTKKSYLLSREDNDMTGAALQWLTDTTGAKTFAFFITEKGSSARNALFRHFRFDDKKTLIDKIDETLIPGRHHYESEYRNSPILKEKMQELKTEKFLESHNVGYRKFYFIAGGDSLQIDNEELEITGNVTAGKLKNAFGKYNKKRQVNRVLVSRFIQEIAV
jgi:hypothetical protein